MRGKRSHTWVGKSIPEPSFYKSTMFGPKDNRPLDPVCGLQATRCRFPLSSSVVNPVMNPRDLGSWKKTLKFTLNVCVVIVGHAALHVSASPDRVLSQRRTLLRPFNHLGLFSLLSSVVPLTSDL